MSSSESRTVNLQPPTSGLTGKLALVAVALPLVWIVAGALFVRTAFPLFTGFVALGATLVLALKIGEVARLRSLAKQSEGATIEVGDGVLRLPAALVEKPLRSIPLARVTRCVVETEKRGFAVDDSQFLVEVGSDEGTHEARIGASWFAGGEDEARELAAYLENRIGN